MRKAGAPKSLLLAKGRMRVLTMASSSAWNVDLYSSSMSFVPELGRPLLDLLPEPPLRVLDLGCGEGALSMELVDRGFSVVGLDADEAMISAARDRGLNAIVGNGEDFDLGDFDAVVSNAALHWMDPARAVEAVRRCLGPGGVFVGECGGEGNVKKMRKAIETAVPNEAELCPWTFPSLPEFTGLLKSHGFQVDSIEIFERPTPMTDPVDWVRMFGSAYFEEDNSGNESPLIQDIAAVLPEYFEKKDDFYMIDYVRLRWKATVIDS